MWLKRVGVAFFGPGMEFGLPGLRLEISPIVAVVHKHNFLPRPFRQLAKFIDRRVYTGGEQLAVVKYYFEIKALVE